MRRVAPVVFLLLIACAIGSYGAKSTKSAKPPWPKYTGAFFTVDYPPGFSVRPSMRVTDPKDACESAFFTSPDKSVEFYVFGPRWDGDAKDIAVNARSEVKVSQKTVKEKSGSTRWVTIRAKDGSYTRSIVAKLNKRGGTYLALQFKYANQQSYAKYKSDYARFKASVRVIGE